MKHSCSFAFYDSHCGFCSYTTGLLRVWIGDRQPIFWADLRTVDSREILREHGIRFVTLNTIYVIIDGAVYSKSRAILMLFRLTGFHWLANILLKLPQHQTDKIYDFIAKHRYKISRALPVPGNKRLGPKL